MNVVNVVQLPNSAGEEFQDDIIVGENFVAVVDGVFGFEDPKDIMSCIREILRGKIVPTRKGIWKTLQELVSAARGKRGACTLALVAWEEGKKGYAIVGAHIGDAGVALFRGGKIVAATFDPVEAVRDRPAPWYPLMGKLDNPFGYNVLWRNASMEGFTVFSFYAKYGDEVVLFTDGGRALLDGEPPEEHGDVTFVVLRAVPRASNLVKSLATIEKASERFSYQQDLQLHTLR